MLKMRLSSVCPSVCHRCRLIVTDGQTSKTYCGLLESF